MQKRRSKMVEFECGGYRKNVRRFQGGLVLQAHGLLCHSTLASRAMHNEKRGRYRGVEVVGGDALPERRGHNLKRFKGVYL